VEAVITENSAGWTEVSRKNQEFTNFVCGMETNFPVDRWMVDGVHVWPIVRLHLYYSFFDFQFFATEPVRAGVIKPMDVARLGFRVFRSLWRFISATISDSDNCLRPNGQYDVLFLNYNTYMTLLNGSWYSRVCDPFIEQLSEKGMTSLMLTGGYDYSIPRFTKSVFIQPHLVMHRLWGMVGRSSGNDALVELREIEAHAKASGLFSESFALVAPIERHLRQIRGIACYFKRILTSTRPKAVFVTCYYGTESMACILACNELGIPTIDIQHGSQGAFHVGYGQWNRVPPLGYELLPTFFWCWGESEAAAIREWSASLPVHQPMVGGNLFLERWVAGNDDTVRAYDKILADLKRPNRDRVHILYTLNGCTKDELKAMVDILDAVNRSGLESFFWVRLHPISLDQKSLVRRTLEESGIRNADVENSTVLPLYAILRHVDVHMTEFSSVVIEAESFHVPSVIGELGVVSFRDQIATGWAVTAQSTPEWVQGIRLQLDRRATLAARRRQSVGAAPEAFDHLLDLLRVGPELATPVVP